MNIRNLLNLSLLIFIIVLVMLVAYEPGKDKAKTPPTLTNLKAENINHITLQVNNNVIELNKTTTGWMMHKPYQHPANSFRIDSILKLLSTVSLSKNNLTNLNPKKFGLDKPVASITFNKNTTITFGHNKSLKHHRYVQLGSDLHMTTDTFYYQLAAKTESFIDHKLLPQNSKITKLSLPNKTFSQKDGKWTITPQPEKFSADSVNQLISEWQLSQAYDIEITQANPKTKADISLQLANKNTVHFKIESNKDNFVLLNIDSGLRYILSKDRKDKLLELSAVNSDNG